MSDQSALLAAGSTVQPAKSVFLSCLDSYVGRILCRVLSSGKVPVKSEDDDVDDEEGESGEEKESSDVSPVCNLYGVKRDPDSPLTDQVQEFISGALARDRSALLPLLLRCDVIVYDITTGGTDIVDEAVWVIEALGDKVAEFAKRKTFILISTVLTWARTKPPEEEEDIKPVFTEDDYRKRRAHPEFSSHLKCEKTVFTVGKVHKKMLRTFVVASGALYGDGEDTFHSWVKSAWHNCAKMPVYGRGGNTVPAVHVRDLAQVVHHLALFNSRNRYILAVDGVNSSQISIVKAIKSQLTSAAVQKVDETDVFADELNFLQANLVVANIGLKSVILPDMIENMHCETGFVASVSDIIQEYRTARNLLPVRICVHGPPVVGKTLLSQRLAKHYKLHHLTLYDVIQDAIKSLETLAFPNTHEKVVEDSEHNRVDEGSSFDFDEEEEDDIFHDEDLPSEEAEQLLAEVRQQLNPDQSGRIDETTVLQFVKERITSKPCRNQGFVLDGYPKLLSEAAVLFGTEEVNEDNPEVSESSSIVPDLVVSLQASDDFLRDRALNLPIDLVEGTHWTEEGVNRRLKEFRANNTEDKTVLNFFDEREIFPLTINVENDKSDNLDDTFQSILKKLGSPRNYGLTPEEKQVLEAREAMEKEKRETLEREEREKLKKEEDERLLSERRSWAESMARIKLQELEVLEARTLPLRKYLMKHVLPTLTKALFECSQVRPEDPLDFIAEYLFMNNPQTNLLEWEEVQRENQVAKEEGKRDSMQQEGAPFDSQNNESSANELASGLVSSGLSVAVGAASNESHPGGQ